MTNIAEQTPSGAMKARYVTSPGDSTSRFWNAHPSALFTRRAVAEIRRCSVALLEREAWSQGGIPFLRDGGRCLYRKADVVRHLGLDVQ